MRRYNELGGVLVCLILDLKLFGTFRSPEKLSGGALLILSKQFKTVKLEAHSDWPSSESLQASTSKLEVFQPRTVLIELLGESLSAAR